MDNKFIEQTQKWFDDGFKAGQQSKQVEIDKNHRLIHIDDLSILVHWTEMMASEYGDDDAVEIALKVKTMIGAAE